MARRFDLSSPRQASTVGLALIAILVTLQFAGTSIATSRQELSAIQINLSGRQRMLSQRIGWTMSKLVPVSEASAEAARLRGLLGVCVDLMERSQRALIARDIDQMRMVLDAGTSCLTPDPSAVLALPAERTALVEPANLAAFTERAWQVAVGGVPRVELSELLIDFEQPLNTLLGQLDEETLAAQEASTAQLKALLSLNWFLILALVLFELVLIFRPMARAVEASFTKLREANSRLRQSETRVQDFASTAAHQFWETDSEHRFTWIGASEPGARLLGTDSSIGRRFWELEGVLTDDNDVDWDSFRQTLNAHIAFKSFDYPVVDSSGKRRWWRLNGRPSFSDDGDFQGYRGTTLEITNERERERQLRLSERMRALGQLTAGVAHDFNNILAVIRGSSDLIPKESTRAGRLRSVQAINDAVSRGASLVQRLLVFGQVQPLQSEVVDLRVFLYELGELLQRTLGEDFNVSVTLPFDVQQVLADRHQLEDACLNIALNARDAAKPGGRLWIDVQLADRGRVASLVGDEKAQSDFVCLSFSDDGSGMPQEVRDRIFEPFYSTKEVGQGSGLGLSMVYGFALQSNGFVDVKSTEGEGTTFELYLPLVDRVSDTEDDVPDDSLRIADGLSVLLVEDNDTLRRVTRRHLESLGFDVVEASGGGSALEQLEYAGHFDVLMLDIVLPGGIDGIEVYRQAREKDPDVKVLFCSGLAALEREADGGDRIPGPLLRKPFGFEQLAEALEDLIASTSGESSLSVDITPLHPDVPRRTH